jgi:Xaa-Pro dipeptidase
MSQSPSNQEALKSILLQRHAKLAVALHNSGLDALILNPGPTLVYLTGLEFHLMERPVIGIFRPHSPLVLILPELESGKITRYPLPIQVFTYAENPAGWPSVIQQGALAAHLNGSKAGIELGRLRVLELRYLEDAAHEAGFVSADPVISDLRMIKDDAELGAMRKAVQIAQDALQATLPAIHAGVTEREIAAELTLQLLRHGSSPEMPFSPIVASGPNSANPHAVPTERSLQMGDVLIIDWGATYRGYLSDLTRTFAIGEVDPEMVNIAKIVAAANQTALQAARPDLSAGQVDRAARQVIEKAGYGKYFFHRTGHGLGMEPHEPPYIFLENELELKQGMTFTIEPGIYLAGRGGVRIEDNVAVTAQGAESLSSLPRELIRLD